jgi:hypothetical protein
MSEYHSLGSFPFTVFAARCTGMRFINVAGNILLSLDDIKGMTYIIREKKRAQCMCDGI